MTILLDDDYRRAAYQRIELAQPTTPEPGWFTGMGAEMSGAAGRMADIARLGTANVFKRTFDALGQTDSDMRDFFKTQEDTAKQELRTGRPDPGTTGVVAQMAANVAQVIGIAIPVGLVAGPFAAAAVTGLAMGVQEDVEMQGKGVDPLTGMKLGVMKGLTMGVGVAMPVAFGAFGRLGNAGYSAAANAGLGMVDRFGAHRILADKYPVMAEHYKALDGAAFFTDLAIGGILGFAFGGKRVNPAEAQDAAAYTATMGAVERGEPAGLHRTPESLAAHEEGVLRAQEALQRGEEPSGALDPRIDLEPDSLKGEAYIIGQEARAEYLAGLPANVRAAVEAVPAREVSTDITATVKQDNLFEPPKPDIKPEAFTDPEAAARVGDVSPMEIEALRQAVARQPDMRVTDPETGESMPLSDALAKVQESIEGARIEAETYYTAAACALLHGE